MTSFDLSDDLTAEAVAEVEAESGGHVYRAGSWRGWEDAAGRRNPNMHVPGWKADELDGRVIDRLIVKRREREEALESARAAEAARAEDAQAQAEQQREYADALRDSGYGGGSGGGGTGGRRTRPGSRIAAEQPRYPAGHPQAGQYRPLTEEEKVAQGVGGGGGDEEGGGGGSLWQPRSPQSEYSVPRHIANLFSRVVGAGAGMATAGVGMALSPLGATGAGATQVGSAAVSLLTAGLNTAASAGSAVLSLALGGLLATAVGGAAAVVLSAVGDLFGQIAQAITGALQGLVTVIRDLFRDAGQYAASVMQMVYVGGWGVGDATGAVGAFGALGMSPEQTSGLLGQWNMRPEFLEARLGALGGLQRDEGGEVDWISTLRGMRGALGSYPAMAQMPVLQGLLGPQAGAQLMPMMQMDPEAFERAVAGAEALEAPTEQLRALREELAPMQAQVALLATVLKTELAGAALEPILGLLRTLLELVRENRGAISEWMADLPERLSGWIADATRWIDRMADSLPRVAEGLRSVVDRLEATWDTVKRIGEFVSAHPTLSAMLAGGALGALSGGVPGMISGAALGGGVQVGAALGGVGGGFYGGAAGLVGSALLSRYGGAGLTAARSAIGGMMAGGGSLAFPLGAGGASMMAGGGAGSLLTAQGSVLAGGGAAATAASLAGPVALLTGIAIGVTGIAAWTSGWWGAYKQQKEAERQVEEQQRIAAETGFAGDLNIVRERFGEETAKKWQEGELPPRLQQIVGEAVIEETRAKARERRASGEAIDVTTGRSAGAQDGIVGAIHGAMERVRETMAQVAANTRPDRVQEAVRRATEAASARQPAVVELRPAPDFQRLFEVAIIQDAYRQIQVGLH